MKRRNKKNLMILSILKKKFIVNSESIKSALFQVSIYFENGNNCEATLST